MRLEPKGPRALRCHLVPLGSAIVAAGMVIAAVTGCSTTVAGQQAPGEAARAAADLESVLLTAGEVDAVMGASAMAADTTKSTLVDDSADTAPVDCLAVSSMGEEQVYSGTSWRAVRMQSVHEPGDDYAHLVHQAVVEFPDVPAAAAFAAASAEKWASCAPGRYTYRPGGGQPPTVWDVGGATQKDGILSLTITEQDSDSWACQRALTAALNIVVDVLTCSAAPGDSAASVAHRIADKVTGQ